MSALDAFLNPEKGIEEIKEITISDRFKNPDGSLATIKLKRICVADNDAIMEKCKKVIERNGQKVLVTDTKKYEMNLLLACIVEPNFQDPEFLSKLKMSSAEVAISRIFTVGEYAKIVSELSELLGVNNVGDDLKN